ncbi:class I SAM-dependent methyltransferase [Massilia sp. Se16.2.3]|uniref:class I SAM-dependent methyltransferase n=1 Tax=Massilia sp. Se16.2.3 TaxID=2709303 RepID=UPI001E331DDD|nr:class I SAM-dependent methyltransferase [Massilia sp. Se16.2.3]
MDAQLDPQLHHQAEQERIGQVYRGWHGGAALARYAWHRPDVVRQQGMRSRVLSHMLATTLGTDLGGVRVIDVGCGTGGFLRQLIDWGATPPISPARNSSKTGSTWHARAPRPR